MSKKAKAGNQPPKTTLSGLSERIRLELELISRTNDLRNFSVIRDRLVAFGKDANEAYRELVKQRDTVAAKLSAFDTPPRAKSKIIAPPRDLPLLDWPIAPANFQSVIGGIPGFGHSGFVQAGPLSEGASTDEYGIGTVFIGAPTYVDVGGRIVGDAENVYYSMHNWQVLVPFPAPSVLSYLTYRFNAGASFYVERAAGDGLLCSFVSVGEMTTLDLAVPVPLTWVGFSLVADLSQATLGYNGSFGWLSGQLTVQRSFVVNPENVSAVSIVVGAAVLLPKEAAVYLAPDAPCEIGIYGTQDYPGEYIGGKIAYNVAPVPVIEE